jgi:tetratricopeptide (TPR) repeat protein
MTTWSALSERAAAAAARGEIYRADGFLRTAAGQYRRATEMLEQAVALRKTEIGEKA